MSQKIYFGSPEDDMEFMPIIPLNEDGGENNDDQAIPAELPLLPLRNTVLFPGVVLPITVGRDKSIKAVNDAYKSDKLVGVVSQKDSVVEEPVVSDLVDIGTVAKIVKLIKCLMGVLPSLSRERNDLRLTRLHLRILISRQRSVCLKMMI